MQTLARYCFLLVLSLLTSQSFAQREDTIQVRVFYAYAHILDNNQKEKVFQEEMLLALGKSASVYTSLSKIHHSQSLQQQAEEQSMNYTGKDFPVITYTPNRYTTSTEIYRYMDTRKMYVKENLVRDYLYEDTFPEIQWQLLADTMRIKGFLCQKAVSSYKGRKWTAWFSPEIPFSAGPWLLGGLPGLILEAEDDKKEVIFRLSGIEKAQHGPHDAKPISEFKQVDYTQAVCIDLPKERISTNNKVKVVRTTKSNVTKLRQAMLKDPRTFMKAQMEASNGIIYDLEAFHALRLRPVVNNPIALEGE